MPDQMITPPVPADVLAEVEAEAVKTVVANGTNIAADFEALSLWARTDKTGSPIPASRRGKRPGLRIWLADLSSAAHAP